MKKHRIIFPLVLVFWGMSSFSYAAELGRIQLRESLGWSYEPQILNYFLKLDRGKVREAGACTLRDSKGKPMLAQFRIMDRYADDSIHTLRVSLIAGLKPFETKSFVLDDSGKAPADDGALKLTHRNGNLIITSPLIGVEIPELTEVFSDINPPPAEIPPPISRIRGKKAWYGKGQLLADSYLWLRKRSVTISDDGPIFKRINVRYEFANGVPSSTGSGNASLYTVEITLGRSEELVRIKESYSFPFTDKSKFEFAFNFSPGLNPDTTVCRPLTSPKGPSWGLGSFWDLRPWRGKMFPIQYRRNDDSHGFLSPWGVGAASWCHYACYNEKQGKQAEMVGIIDTAPENWTHQAYLVPEETWKLVQDPHAFFSLKPIKDVRLSTGTDGNLTAHFRLNAGTREWAFFVGGPFPRVETYKKGRGKKAREVEGPAAPRNWFTRKTWHYAWDSLDRIKDYVLEWKPDPSIHYPRLYATAAEYAKRREIWNKWYGGKPLPPLNDPGMQQKMKARLLATTAQAVEQFSGRIGPPHGGVSIAMLVSAHLSDLLFGTGVLTPAEERLVRARMAYMAYVTSRKSYWAPGNGYAANPNMTVILYSGLCMDALALPDHPMSRKWVNLYRWNADATIKNWMSDDGAWIESLHYVRASWTYHRMPFAALKHLGIVDYYSNPRVQKFFRYYFDMQTPPDSELNGQRHLECIGNGYERETIEDFGIWAKGVKDSNPQLAEQLMWMWKQEGYGTAAERKGHKFWSGGAGNFHFWGSGATEYYKLALYDPMIKAVAPKSMHGARYRGFGSTMEAHVPGDKETKVFFRMGKFYSHWDMSAGHFVFWGKGAPLCMDHGYGEFHPWFHNRVVVNHMWDEALGEVTDFFAANGAAYSEGEVTIDRLSLREHPAVKKWPFKPEPLNGRSPKTWWQRRLVLMEDKAADGPNYLVIRDVVKGQLPTEWILWVYGDVQDFQTIPIRAKGRVGTDLLVYLLDSDRGKVNTGIVDLSKKAIPRRKQTLIHLLRPAGRGTLALLYPLAAAEKTIPVVTRLPDNAGIKLVAGNRTDWVFLPEYRRKLQVEGITFSGMTGSFSRRADCRYYMFSGNSKLSADGLSVQSNSPGELFVYPDRMEGTVHNADIATQLVLAGDWVSKPITLQVNDQESSLAPTDESRRLILPLGDVRFTLRRQP